MKKPKVSVNERSFYHWNEAAIVPLSALTSNDDAGKLEFIDYNNGTPSLDGGVSCFENGGYRMINKARNYVHATGISELLAKCGFSIDKHFSERRNASILLKSSNTVC